MDLESNWAGGSRCNGLLECWFTFLREHDESQVAVEQMEDGSFQASTAFPLALSSVGPSKESVLASIHEMARERMAKCEIFDLQIDGVSNGEHPWMKFAGIWKDEPMFDEYVEAIEDYKRSVDER